MKDNLKFKKYYRLFLSYLLVFLVPTVVISSAVFKISDEILKEEIQNSNMMNVRTAQYNLSKTLESFSVAATSAAYSNFGHTIHLEKEVTASMELISFLNVTTMSYIFMQDIFMIYPDGDYIYSGQSSFMRDNFYEYLNFDGMDAASAAEYFSKLEEPSFLKVNGIEGALYADEKTKNYILYSIPCTRREYTTGIMAFLIDVDKLNLFLGNNGDAGYIYLVDNEKIALNGNEEYEKQLQSFRGMEKEQLAGQSSELFYYNTDTYTYIYGNILPGLLNMVSVNKSEKALGRLYHFRDLSLLTLLLVFCLGMLCVLFAYIRNKRELIKVTSYYEQELNQFLPLKQKELLYAIIEGRYLYENDLTIQCEQCMMDVTANFHYCILVKYKESMPDIKEFLSEAAKDEAIFNYIYYVNKVREADVYLVGTESELPSALYHYAKDGISLYIGRATSNVLNLHLSYAEVFSQMYIQESRQEGETSGEEEKLKKYHYERIIKRINAAISTSDTEKLKKWEKELLTDLDQKEIDLSMRRKLLLQLSIAIADSIEQPIAVDEILKMESLEEVHAGIRKLFQSCTASAAEAEAGSESNLDTEKIKAYITDNYTDPMFSLQMLADEFHVSNSYLSWFFKQKTGNTILDYTTQLKMDLATKLLGQGYALQEVAVQVGYINVSSFIRRFKQTMGMTPGEYKKNNKS